MNKLKIAFLATLLSAFAMAKDKNPADYPLTAHVVSSSAGEGSSGVASSYDVQTGKWTYGTLNSSGDPSVVFRVGNLLYTGGYGCRKHVQVGTEVHVRIEKNKKLYILTDDGDTCWTRIYGVQEIGPAK